MKPIDEFAAHSRGTENCCLVLTRFGDANIVAAMREESIKMAKMKAIQIPKANGAFELVERELPEPESGQVRIKVQACGVCHSDSFVKEGTFPAAHYPIVPGHEIAGTIDALGPGVNTWKTGQRVGVGWYGGHCGECESCRRGDFITCQNLRITGITCDGGYAGYTVANTQALARIPDEFSPEHAAPIMCAGVTTYNALRNSGARAGDLVGILGLGGLGHLGVQFARKMGFRTVAITRGREKEAPARELGAHYFFASTSDNVASELTRLGGAQVLLATAVNAKAMSAVIDGLDINGRLVVVGSSADPIAVLPQQLIREAAPSGGGPLAAQSTPRMRSPSARSAVCGQ